MVKMFPYNVTFLRNLESNSNTKYSGSYLKSPRWNTNNAKNTDYHGFTFSQITEYQSNLLNMKRANTILVIILLVVVAGCKGNEQSTDGFITVDVSKSYPKKELILQNFMDVEYITLETTNEFLTQGLVQAVGKEYLLVVNRANDGNIFIFDRKTGKGLRTINRQGQGPEEYVRANGIILDEANGEMFVRSANKILVYDLYGKFKRCLNFNQEYTNIFDYNKDNLIGYDMSDYYKKGLDRGKAYHVIISKLDGSIIREILIPFKMINTPIVIKEEGTIANYFPLIRPTNHDKWILVETSSDTLYNYAPDGTLSPFIVRTPSTNAMEPEVFLTMGILTDRYYFMEAFKNEFNFEKGSGFYSDRLMYDKEENALFQFSVYNDDYSEKRTVGMTSRPINQEIEASIVLEAHRLVENYEKGELKDGKLKEIAAKLDAEDNPVIMLVKHKK